MAKSIEYLETPKIPDHIENQILELAFRYIRNQNLSEDELNLMNTCLEKCSFCASKIQFRIISGVMVAKARSKNLRKKSIEDILDDEDSPGRLKELFYKTEFRMFDYEKIEKNIPKGRFRLIGFNEDTHKFFKVDDYESYSEAYAVAKSWKKRKEVHNASYHIIDGNGHHRALL